ncbi:helix-turn-helix domain-containing protein [Bizionia sp. M204]|uniref:helix-turn-helix domain-containing protein n=1 Tax=Bizionia sp. M204 TaxID=2675331 RepID=UPI00205B8107|nr:helix-turn-helix domain-containing protein [Bizionia sp. M204]UPS90462.1 helix-turn-helix domain-containing protein [Bizionia sp. M204]
MRTLNFENLPNAVAELIKGQSELRALLLQKANLEPEMEVPIQVDGVMPITGFSKPTIYGYVQRNEIPYHKKGNRLYFFKSEIIDWIKQGKQKTIKEVETDVDTLLSNKGKRLRK